MKTLVYNIAYKNHTLSALLQTSKDTHGIKFGGRKPSCVYITIYRHVDTDDHSIAQLDGVSHDSLCNMEGDLENGQGTIDMTKAACTFVTLLFPYVKSFMCKDTSYITCKNHMTISLSCISVTKYGNTRYQRMFHAMPCLPSNQTRMTQAYEYINQNKGKSFNRFWNTYIEPRLSIMRRISKNGLKESFEEIWNASDSYAGFFKELIAMDCMFVTPWLEDYYSVKHNMTFQGIEYVIHIEGNRVDIQYSKTKHVQRPPYETLIPKLNGGMYMGYIADVF